MQLTVGIVGGIVGFLAYIVLCIIIAATATQTNRSGKGYFVLSVVFSPLTGFIALSLSMLAKIELTQEKTAEAKEAGTTSRREIKCKRCNKSFTVDFGGHFVVGGRTNCPHCGSEITSADT